MARLTQLDRERVLVAITEAERRTAAEFAVAIASSADRYAELRLLAPALLAIMAPPFLLASGLLDEPLWLASVPGLLFLAVSAALLPNAVAVRLVPPMVRETRARRLAQTLFLELGLAAPRERAGVLLFIARAERRIEILAGPGIAERIDPADWERIVDRFVRSARSGPLPAALVGAVESVATLLSNIFPPAERNPDEVANRLIEL
ncbi:MAG TPA: TPM domain-containing protein [Alphaproteobacteria bacterium]|nr:TPM domain-containing protein [Alphaproteobacteria bacterium]